MATTLKFGKLPEQRSGSLVTEKRAAELIAHPGEWAEWPSRVAGSVVKAQLAKVDARGGRFEVVTRGSNPQVPYARWVAK